MDRKRLIICLLLTFLLSLYPSVGIAGTGGGGGPGWGNPGPPISSIDLPIKVKDALIDPERTVIYMSGYGKKEIYSVDYTSGSSSTVSFVYTPESLELGRGLYADELYAALLHREHSYYWREEDQTGTIAVIDRNTFQVKDTIDLLVDPYDIVAGRDGYIYIPSGSGQWTNFQSYSRLTKRLENQTMIRQMSHAKLHPAMERIYTIDTDSSPRDMRAYNTAGGDFTDPKYPGGYDSPYHGDYPLTVKIALDPTGKYLFNGSGGIFTTNADRNLDMRYAARLDAGFEDIAFEPDLSRFYTLSSNSINVYRGNDFSRLYTIPLANPGKYIFRQGDRLVVITPSGLNPDLDAIRVLPLNPMDRLSFDLNIYPLSIGDTRNTEITAFYCDGSAVDVTSHANFTSSNPAVAKVSSSGKVTAITPGVTTITASYAGYQSSADVTVTAYVKDGIYLDCLEYNLTAGETHQTVVTAVYNGSSFNVTPYSTFLSSKSTVASVEPSGLVTGISSGKAVIIAIYGNYLTSANVCVSAPTMGGRLSINPSSGKEGAPGQNITLSYYPGETITNGFVMFRLPAGFNAIPAADTATLPDREILVLTDNMIEDDGKSVLVNISKSIIGQAIELNLKNKTLPSPGIYQFKCQADADGEGTEKKLSFGIGHEAKIFAVISNPKIGDVNGDGSVNVQDAVLIINITLNKISPTEKQKIDADLNMDGDINILDAVKLINIAIGEINGI